MTKQTLADKATYAAVLVLIGTAFYIASRAFWGVNLHRMEIVVITTLTFASTAWLLSSVLPAILEVFKPNPAAAGVLTALGFFLLILEIILTHAGLQWFTGQSVASHLKPTETALWIVSAGISVFNIFAKWGFLVVVKAVRDSKVVTAEDQARREWMEENILREKNGLKPKKWSAARLKSVQTAA